MGEATVMVRDFQGPYAGQARPYLKTAGDNAVTTGYAEYADAEPEARDVGTPLPDTFPALKFLQARGVRSVEDLRALDLSAVPGLGKKRRADIVAGLGELG